MEVPDHDTSDWLSFSRKMIVKCNGTCYFQIISLSIEMERLQRYKTEAEYLHTFIKFFGEGDLYTSKQIKLDNKYFIGPISCLLIVRKWGLLF
ncbi:hypothetical protein [Siminovitchia sp. 179-K 8D1 HS]|uniref:hypothetical protein n=1 Tax=Siminovitchia sp. 179-K 8D1 HS TaxID=3142385 RepID=UPI0039A1848E